MFVAIGDDKVVIENGPLRIVAQANSELRAYWRGRRVPDDKLSPVLDAARLPDQVDALLAGGDLAVSEK